MATAQPVDMAQKLEELFIWRKSIELWGAVNALLDRPGFSKNWDLHDQLTGAVDSVVANIPEGFEQSTDRAFAKYLYTAKGSAAEINAHLLIALKRGHIEQSQFDAACALSVELQKMLGGFIKYLIKSNRKDRGTGKADVQIPRRRRRTSR